MPTLFLASRWLAAYRETKKERLLSKALLRTSSVSSGRLVILELRCVWCNCGVGSAVGGGNSTSSSCSTQQQHRKSVGSKKLERKQEGKKRLKHWTTVEEKKAPSAQNKQSRRRIRSHTAEQHNSQVHLHTPLHPAIPLLHSPHCPCPCYHTPERVLAKHTRQQNRKSGVTNKLGSLT